MFKPVFKKRQVIVFKQFQRKGYSLFACLGREVVISVLSVATLSSATAATDRLSERESEDTTLAKTTREVMLQDVSIMGSRAPLSVSQAARMVTVLSREDIAQASVQSINDLLKFAIGVDVRQRGSLGTQTDVSIRGGTEEQIVILLNGINICDPQTGHNAFDLPCHISDIVRIEVLEGPAGRIYGTSSLVGAINIVTSQQPQTQEVYLEGGSYGFTKIGGRLLLSESTQKPCLGSLSASYSRSDGYSRSRAGRRNTDYSGSKVFYQGDYDDESIRLKWHIGLSDKGWGSGTFYATPKWQADEQYEHTTKIHAAVQSENRLGYIHLQPAIYWNQNRDRYEGYRGQPDIMKYNFNLCNIYGLKLNTYFDSRIGRTAFGAELRNEDLLSSNLGEPLLHSHHIKGTDRDYTLGINRTNISAHLEHNILLDHLTVSVGFVAAKSSCSNMNLTIYPGMDASYHIGQQWKVFVSYNSSLRLPSFTEMYYKLQGYAANPHLKPEKMRAIEIGTQYTSPTLQAKFTAYHHHGKDMIDWIMDTRQGNEAQWQSVNHTRLNTYGMEINARLATRLGSVAVAYSYICQDKELEAGIVSQYALEYLRHQLVATVQTKPWRGWSLRIDGRYQDRVGQYTNFNDEVCNYRPYALFDGRIQWQTNHYTLFTQVNNMFDNTTYVDYGNVPQPGAWFTAGLHYTF